MLKRLLRRTKDYLPRPAAAILYLFAVAALVAGLVLSASLSLTSFEGYKRLSMFGFTYGFLVLPFVALFMEIAALLTRNIPAKLVLGLSVILVLAIGSVVGGIGYTVDPDSTATPLSGLAVTGFCFGPFIVLAMIIPTYCLVRLPESLRAIRQAQWEREALQFIHEHEDEVTYKQLGEYLHLPENRVNELLRHLIASKRIAGVREPQTGRFYTQAAFAEHQRNLLGMVASRGAISLDDMARETGMGHELLKARIYALVHQGKFAGYINWDEELLYSAEASQLRAAGKCPSCSAPMELAGKGMIHCAHCGTEVFLAPLTEANGDDEAAVV